MTPVATVDFGCWHRNLRDLDGPLAGEHKPSDRRDRDRGLPLLLEHGRTDAGELVDGEPALAAVLFEGRHYRA
jgi:hypothetical protein